MHDDGSIELLNASTRGQQQELAARRAALAEAQQRVDDARLALTELAAPAVKVIAMRLLGVELDAADRLVTEERERTAFNVLDRIGIGKVRAHQIAASFAFAPASAAPGSPDHGEWSDAGEDPELKNASDQHELDPTTIDAQINAFLEGARVAKDLEGK